MPQDDPALPEMNFPHAARWRTEFIETNGVRERSPYEDSRPTEHVTFLKHSVKTTDLADGWKTAV